MNMHKTAVVVNAASFTSGIGRYADSLYEALRPNSSLLNLRMDRRINFDHGETINGVFPPITNGWSFNITFYDSIYNKRIKKTATDSVIHYSSIIGKPIKNSIATIHDLMFLKYDDNYPRLYKRWLNKNIKYYKRLENIVTVSDYVKKQLVNNGFEGNITRIYPSVSDKISYIEDKKNIREQLNLPADKTLILVVASSEKRKNLKILRELDLSDNFHLVNVGDSINGSLGFKSVDEEKLNLLYNACDVLLSPSLDEGFGYPVLEAMKAGLPVVASDIEIYNETTMGRAVLVDISDVKHIKAGIRDALSNRETLSINGRNFVTKYSFQAFRKNLLEFYENEFPLEKSQIDKID